MRFLVILLLILPSVCYSNNSISNNLPINSHNDLSIEVIVPKKCNNHINPQCLSKVEFDKLYLFKKEQKKIEKDFIKNDDDSFIGNTFVFGIIFTLLFLKYKK